ncbi:MAG: hypothetical protein ACREVH_10815 [Gammaproteobacteria bacterium]
MSQETLADDRSHRVGAVRNIAFVVRAMRQRFRRMLRVSPQDYRARFKSTVLH